MQTPHENRETYSDWRKSTSTQVKPRPVEPTKGPSSRLNLHLCDVATTVSSFATFFQIQIPLHWFVGKFRSMGVKPHQLQTPFSWRLRTWLLQDPQPISFSISASMAIGSWPNMSTSQTHRRFLFSRAPHTKSNAINRTFVNFA